MIDSDGAWAGSYLPAFLRRSPFILGNADGEKQVVCIDEACENFVSGGGERLFDHNGEVTKFLEDEIRFANSYYANAMKTEAAVRLICELDLLQSIIIEAAADKSNAVVIYGFLTLDRSRLDALSERGAARLRGESLLGHAYAQVFSLDATRAVSDRLAPSH